MFRTEYLFLTHPNVPDEEEQLAAYREIIAASPNHQVTIRTLDLGGDKTIPYLGHDREANPFMGWRLIRLSFEHPEFFTRQIRAILRAAAKEPGMNKRVRMMFPMITTLEEMRRVRTMVRKARQQLKAEGKPYGPVRIGLMLEVPAAAVSIHNLLEEVDFVSVGSNDLVQYLMAADRDNPKVSHLCQPLSPPVLQVLAGVIRACREPQTGDPVRRNGRLARGRSCCCSAWAAQLQHEPGLHPHDQGTDAPPYARRAERIVRRALEIKTTAGVQRFMAAQIAEIAPNLKLLDSSDRAGIVCRSENTAPACANATGCARFAKLKPLQAGQRTAALRPVAFQISLALEIRRWQMSSLRSHVVGLLLLVTAVALAVVSGAWAQKPHEHEHEPAPAKQAVAVLAPTSGSHVSGTLLLTQEQGYVHITGDVKGLKAGQHGFHIHAFGDLRKEDGSSAGPHYDPDGHPHGGPGSPEHHAGDLGNIVASDEGAKVDVQAKGVPLHFIIGRSLVVHAKADNLKSQPAGDSGPRIAVGVIGVADAEPKK